MKEDGDATDEISLPRLYPDCTYQLSNHIAGAYLVVIACVFPHFALSRRRRRRVIAQICACYDVVWLKQDVDGCDCTYL